ncbi:MAG: hypothetical protein RLZZ461_1126, partial [Planctomycetota bacterium]|jgi:hypothetical protein
VINILQNPARWCGVLLMVGTSAAATSRGVEGDPEPAHQIPASTAVRDHAPVIDETRLPPAPIAAACDHLLEAESQRIGLPAGRSTLQDVLRVASAEAGINIEGDWAALDAIGIQAKDPVEPPAAPASLPVLLEQLLSRLSDAWDRPRIEATADGILLTSDDGATHLTGTILHPIGDLLHGDPLPTAIPGDELPEDSTAMAELLQSMIAPDAWANSGGRLARMEVWGEGLLVTAPPSIQIEVRRFLAQLRVARPFEVEVGLKIVPLETDTARRLETSRGAGSLAAVQAVASAALGESVLDASLVAPVDGTTIRSASESADLSATVTMSPTWDATRRSLSLRVSVTLDGTDAGGLRSLEIQQDVGVPVGGLVIPIPANRGQPPLVALVTVRGR